MQTATVNATRQQQVQLIAFHKVVWRQYWSEVAKSIVICVDVACQKLLKSANVSRSYSKNKSGTFLMEYGVVENGFSM